MVGAVTLRYVSPRWYAFLIAHFSYIIVPYCTNIVQDRYGDFPSDHRVVSWVGGGGGVVQISRCALYYRLAQIGLWWISEVQEGMAQQPTDVALVLSNRVRTRGDSFHS